MCNIQIAERTLSKFVDDTKLGGVADTPEGHASIQRDLDRLEKWGNRNLMRFNQEKCKVLPPGRNKPRHQFMLFSLEHRRLNGISSIYINT